MAHGGSLNSLQNRLYRHSLSGSELRQGPGHANNYSSSPNISSEESKHSEMSKLRSSRKDTGKGPKLDLDSRLHERFDLQREIQKEKLLAQLCN